MRSKFYFIFASFIALTSCKEESKKEVNNSSTNVVPFYQNVTPVDNQVATTPANQQGVNTTTATAPVSVAKGMNPAHGQPGHRCDIPVGAPLNSKAAAPTTSNTAATTTGQVSQQINVQQPVPALLSTSTADAETPEGMNPPHGKDGHRCDIAVGAPLPKS
ncbi:hypothetical protein [Flavobacterium acetivorans]|uniref:hypothetical protein n=1 Tax=Flavobacterium acetivorans TaxID=2893883 RepID=UPI001E641D50|nr:hypothetical protein [Flavobacterium sp. F-29]UFH35914.1 hypothetical protein LNP19_02470 [Flavobacterium sp. F-29]